MGRVVLGSIGVLMAAALVAIATAFGLPALFALAWVALLGAVIAVSRQPLFFEDLSWPPERPEPPFRGSEVSRLAWAINPKTGVVAHGLVRRLDAAVRHRLEMRGLDLDAPSDAARIDLLLGPDVRRVLSARTVKTTEAERILTALESLPERQELP